MPRWRARREPEMAEEQAAQEGPLSFEQARDELEAIVRRLLESGFARPSTP